MGADEVVIDHGADGGVIDEVERVDFVGGAEAVEEMQHGDAGAQGGGVGDEGEVMGFLHRGGGEQGEAGAAGGHHVGMVAEDRQGLGGDGAGGDVEDHGGEFAGDLEHVGQHQQQALRCGEGGGERAGLERAVQGAGGPRLGLHFLHHGDVAPDVRCALGRPLVGQFGHRGGGGDGVDGADFADPVGDVGDGGVAVHGGPHGRRSPGVVGIMSMAWQGHCS